MSDVTSRVSLYKPAGGENVNVTTDLNNNLDKIDTNLNFRVVANATARNAISPYWAGLNVRQTNDGTCWVSNGTAPISASWDQIATANTYITNLNVATPATGSSGFVLRTQGEGADRIRMRGDGQLIFGDGTNAPDTNIYRASANTLRTDDSFQVGGSLQAGGDLVTTSGQLALNLGGSAKKNAQPSVAVGPVASTTTETIAATYTIPANDATAGAVYKVTAWGIAGVTGTPTLTFKSRMGGVSGASNASIPITASNGVSGKVWRAELYVSILTVGGSGTWSGSLSVMEGLSVAGGNPVVAVTRLDGGGTAAIDTTIANDLCITLQWSASSASNTWTCRGFAAERIA
jgi:hypothetical protein